MEQNETRVMDRLLEQLMNFSSGNLSFDPTTFILLLLISLFSSFAISVIYVKFYENRATGSQIHRSFPLLGLGITTLFISIQFSLPLSLGLLGALSIVRFRTPIKEPEEIGFLMVLVASSITIATQKLLFLGVLLFMSLVAVIIFKIGPSFIRDNMKRNFIILTIPNTIYHNEKNNILSILENDLIRGEIDGITKNNENTILSYSFISTKQTGIDKVEVGLRDRFPEIEYNLIRTRTTLA